MEQFDLLRFVVAAIERVGLQYFVTGSTVTIFYGEPRFTNDIDIVIRLSLPAVRKFISQFPEDEFYVSEEAALDAVKRQSQFNIIHPQTGLKVDVIESDLDLDFKTLLEERLYRQKVSIII